jgi:hypothetical protein
MKKRSRVKSAESSSDGESSSREVGHHHHNEEDEEEAANNSEYDEEVSEDYFNALSSAQLTRRKDNNIKMFTSVALRGNTT